MITKSVRARMFLALLGSAAALAWSAPALAQEATAAAPVQSEDDIVVTANKRPQAVRDISGSVTAFSGDQLERIGAESLGDYLTRTPGVVFNGATPGNSTVVIRGISTTTGIDQGQGTTGYFINDIPLTDPGYSAGTPDVDAFDVDNVAILRGPQGTLFGSSSLGGAVNYQAAKPDLSGVAGRLEGTVRSVDSGDVGGSAKVMLNLPIVTNRLGVRGVFVWRRDAGYVDNVGTGNRNANQSTLRGGRLLASWNPFDGTEINYMYLEQLQDTKDDPWVVAPAGNLAKTTLVPEFSKYGTLLHNLRIDQRLGGATLTGTVTYHRKTQDSMGDITAAYGPLIAGLLGAPLAPVTVIPPARSSGWTYELRLASNSGGSIDYVVGAYYDRTKQTTRNDIAVGGLGGYVDLAFGPGQGAILAPGDVLLNVSVPQRAREAAVFGEITFRPVPTVELTVGGRYFDQEITTSNIQSGLYTLLLSGVPSVTASATRKENGFNPKFSVSWQASDTIRLYALGSKGFRFGGPNIAPSTPTDPVPAFYRPDSLWNYEAGIRANFLDNRLQLDLTGFYIDWSDIQLRRTTSTGLLFADNGGTAHIYGVEASIVVRPIDGMNLSTNITYLDAALADPFDPDGAGPQFVPAGTRLPGSSRWQISNLASYGWTAGDVAPRITLSHRYISSAESVLLSNVKQGGYHLFDARAGFKFDRFDITAFVENIGNSRGVSTARVTPTRYYVVRPRTIGATLGVRF